MHLDIQETPIQKIHWPEFNNDLFIKREDFIPFSFGGNKVRIANQFLIDMEQGNFDCMITYGQSKSNLCRIVANLCAAAHMDCYVVSSLSENEIYQETYNSQMIRDLGAHIITCRKTEVAATIQNLFSQLQAEGKHPYYTYGTIYGTGNEATATTAYRNAYAEIHRASIEHGPFDYIFLASGTGTTQSGLIAGAQDYNDATQIIGISVARTQEYGEYGIRTNLQAINALHDSTKINFIADHLVDGHCMKEKEIRETASFVFSRFGIPLDATYTGKAFWRMMQYIEDHHLQDKKILFLHTGGTPLFFDELNN